MKKLLDYEAYGNYLVSFNKTVIHIFLIIMGVCHEDLDAGCGHPSCPSMDGNFPDLLHRSEASLWPD